MSMGAALVGMRRIASMRPWDWVPGIAAHPSGGPAGRRGFNEALGLGPRDCRLHAESLTNMYSASMRPWDWVPGIVWGQRVHHADARRASMRPWDWVPGIAGRLTASTWSTARFNEALGLGPRDCQIVHRHSEPRLNASMRPWDWVPGIVSGGGGHVGSWWCFNEALGLGPRDWRLTVLIVSSPVVLQ